MSTSILFSDVDDPFVSRFLILEILIFVDIIVEWLSEKNCSLFDKSAKLGTFA